MNRRDFVSLAGAAGLLPLAAAAAAPVEGKDYTRLGQAVPLAKPGKPEVIEFFGYWCPHCNEFEPVLDAWVAKLPADVNFRRSPVAWSAMHVPYQKLYFALESLGVPESIHPKVFAAIHVQGLRFEKEEAVGVFAAANGIDKAKLIAAMNSFTVATDVQRANQLFAAYSVDGVPTLAVNGRYRTSPSEAGGEQQALTVVDYLLRTTKP
ncbi:MAG: thiol:disulfide interchange protein DsbA/DsbL [Burkholderiales bacterium]|nr:thiol:disulfide interchange protein DsbA/DsbL [Burkholderiales bacterium]